MAQAVNRDYYQNMRIAELQSICTNLGINWRSFRRVDRKKEYIEAIMQPVSGPPAANNNDDEHTIINQGMSQYFGLCFLRYSRCCVIQIWMVMLQMS